MIGIFAYALATVNEALNGGPTGRHHMPRKPRAKKGRRRVK